MDAPRPALLTDEVLAERLREAGYRVTRPRLAVYRALVELGGHRSVDELAGALRAGGHRVPRMTVYNVVGDLVRAGLAMLADAGPGRALYEAGTEWHHHFVCRRCGRIEDVPCLVGKKPCLETPDVSGQVDEAQVIFRGLCAACLSAEEPA